MALPKPDRQSAVDREEMSAESRWNVNTTAPRPVPVGASRADPDRNGARVLSAIALASVAAGAINFAAATTVGRGSSMNLAFFVAVAAAQLVWGMVALVRAPRWWLALGAAGNLVVAATWLVSRTVGVPGVYGGITLPIGFPDGLATALEVVIVVGAVGLMSQGRDLARSAARSAGVAVASAVVVGGLALGGVLAQAGAIGSSPTGNGPSVNGPAVPGGGGGIYGGSTSGSGSTSGGSTSGGSTSGGSSGGGSYNY
jgi:hypothetical protein